MVENTSFSTSNGMGRLKECLRVSFGDKSLFVESFVADDDVDDEESLCFDDNDCEESCCCFKISLFKLKLSSMVVSQYLSPVSNLCGE